MCAMEYSDIRIEDGELRFVISGDDDYGFDKSLVNAIRRTLLTLSLIHI